jgi:hypothetical protein
MRRRFNAPARNRKRTSDGETERRRALRQIALAAKPDALVRFHLRHLEQRDEQAEPVTPRYPRKVG